MVRMSDIIKKAKEKREKEKEKESKLYREPRQPKAPPPPPPKKKVPSQPQPAEPEGIKFPLKEKFVPVEKEKRVSIYKISPAVTKEYKIFSKEDTEKLYDETVSSAKEILKKDRSDYTSIDTTRIAIQVEKIVSQLSIGNDTLLMFALIKDTLHSDYLIGHSVNVCIFSIEIGLRLGYKKSQLIELGISALLHDIGMTKYLDIANQPRTLTADEYDKIKKHSIEGTQILEKIKNITKKALNVAMHHHERIDGSGYPGNLKGESIDEYAKIVSIVDVYEAIIHPRVYRSEHLSLETIREMMAHKDTFDHKVLKVLIEYIGIFPVGSFVELNTKEIAEVLKLNYEFPMRPVVKIIYDIDGKKVEEEKIIDLKTQCNIYCKGCVSIKKGLNKKG